MASYGILDFLAAPLGGRLEYVFDSKLVEKVLE